MKTIEDALAYADTFDAPANKHMSIVMLASEVRRLREENERLRAVEHAAQWYIDNPNSQRMAISQIKAAPDAARGGE